jgi:hypothetical protein
MLSRNSPRILEGEQIEDDRKKEVIYWVIFALNVIFPICEAIGYHQIWTVEFINDQMPSQGL